jgi:hypothetical protein
VPEKMEGELVVIWEREGREMMEFVFSRGAEVSYAAVGVGGWVCGWDWGRYWGCGTGSLTSTISSSESRSSSAARAAGGGGRGELLLFACRSVTHCSR